MRRDFPIDKGTGCDYTAGRMAEKKEAVYRKIGSSLGKPPNICSAQYRTLRRLCTERGLGEGRQIKRGNAGHR